MITFIWIVTALVLLVWSLLSWGLGALLAAGAEWQGDVQIVVDHVPFAAVLDAWVPGWDALVGATVQLVLTLFAWLGALGPWLVGAVWALGTLGLLATAGLLTLLVRWARAAPTPAPGGAA